jgi:hypothetical protein
MKKNLLSILILFCALNTQGQTYTFTFEAATTSPSISSLFVQNLTSGASVLLNGTDTLILETVVGTKELSAETSNNLTVYPNPSAGNFSFGISIQEAAFTNFELIDLNGRKILEKTAWLKSGQYFFTIEGLKSGSYFLKAYNDNYQLVKKIISTAEMTGTPEIKQSFFKESIIENAIGKSDKTSATLSDQGNNRNKNSIRVSMSLPTTTVAQARLLDFVTQGVGKRRHKTYVFGRR